MRVLESIEPKAVFEWFEALSNIPRESGNEKAVSDFIVKAAREKGLEVIQEPCHNVIIKKPGSKGKEHLSPVILQGHLDMVCTKVEGSTHNFETDPLKLIVEGDDLRADGTTLGADNGIAVAMALAIAFDDAAEHPPLELLFTVAEETGMDGANLVDGSLFKGKTLINLDAEMEGFVEASCAGGINCDIILPTLRQPSRFGMALEVTIKGLKGGHSGMEIDKNRANAIQLMGRLLKTLHSEVTFDIQTIYGGEKMNAIAKTATAVIQMNDKEAAEVLIQKTLNDFKTEFELVETEMTLVVREVASGAPVLKPEQAVKLYAMLILTPNGVQTMSAGLPGLVESSNNMGVLTDEDQVIRLLNAPRSSVHSLKWHIIQRMTQLGDLIGADVKTYSDYPAWPFKAHSAIRDLFMATYEDLYHKPMGIEAIHAGLECGLFMERIGDIDMISLGPNLQDVHTPFEKLSIGSTQRVFALVKEVLKRI